MEDIDVFFHPDHLESIKNKHDIMRDQTDFALGLVADYVKLHKLILTGGMAIDMALRSRGSNLYADDVLPDYDFFSSVFHKDAYDIAKILKKNGLPDVSVTNARHTSTLRVRIAGIVVADVTYLPLNVLKKIPTFMYQSFVCVHPHYQMIDQHLALCRPFTDPPMEAIFGRWKKDLTRNELLVIQFPIPNPEPSSWISRPIEILKIEDLLLTGYGALSIWQEKAMALGYKPKVLFPYRKTPDSYIFEMPENSVVSFYSVDYKKVADRWPDKVKSWYYPFTDKLPAKWRSSVEVFDCSHDLISCYRPFFTSNLLIANLNALMVYFMVHAIQYDSSHFTAAFETREIIHWGIVNMQTDFLPSVTVYGNLNLSHAAVWKRQTLLDDVNGVERKYKKPRAREVEKIQDEDYLYEPDTVFLFDGNEIL